MLVEDPMTVETRNNCKKMIASLKKAQDILGEVARFDLEGST